MILKEKQKKKILTITLALDLKKCLFLKWRWDVAWDHWNLQLTKLCEKIRFSELAEGAGLARMDWLLTRPKLGVLTPVSHSAWLVGKNCHWNVNHSRQDFFHHLNWVPANREASWHAPASEAALSILINKCFTVAWLLGALLLAPSGLEDGVIRAGMAGRAIIWWCRNNILRHLLSCCSAVQGERVVTQMSLSYVVWNACDIFFCLSSYCTQKQPPLSLHTDLHRTWNGKYHLWQIKISSRWSDRDIFINRKKVGSFPHHFRASKCHILFTITLCLDS